MAKVPEVIASCYVESIDSNVLLVKDIFTKSHDIVICINNEFYNASLLCYPIESLLCKPIYDVEFVKHAIEYGLISILDKSPHNNKLHYFIIINGSYSHLNNCIRSKNNKIQQFATENRDLFKDNGRPILK